MSQMIEIPPTPNAQPGWATHLDRLRAIGARRDGPSSAYLALKDSLVVDSILIDVGCGESNDRAIAAKDGFTAYGVDLFPPKTRNVEGFIHADARRLPFADNSANAIICQAVIALVPPDDRELVYTEIARTLKPDGLLSMSVYSLADGWQIDKAAEFAQIVAMGFQHVHSGLFRKVANMNDQALMVRNESAVHLVARSPVEMQNAQADLAVWLRNKVNEGKIEVGELNAAVDHAKQHKWSSAALTRQRNKAIGRENWYFRLLTAVEAGYTIIPEFPIDVFAIRVTRSGVRAKDATSTSTWNYPSIANERPDVAAVGEGEYKNPAQLVRHYEYPETRDGKEVTVRMTRAADFQDEVVFPLRAARPAVMSATSQAMALKVFDQIGICLPTRKAVSSTRAPDPLIIGQILGQREGWTQKCASFIVAWHLDLRTL